jgi:hypothetical protein
MPVPMGVKIPIIRFLQRYISPCYYLRGCIQNCQRDLRYQSIFNIAEACNIENKYLGDEEKRAGSRNHPRKHEKTSTTALQGIPDSSEVGMYYQDSIFLLKKSIVLFASYCATKYFDNLNG